MQKREEAEMSSGARNHDASYFSTSLLSANAGTKANGLILLFSQVRSVQFKLFMCERLPI